MQLVANFGIYLGVALLATLVVGVSVVAITLPCMLWVETIRLVVRPVAARFETTRGRLWFSTTDLVCLVLELSVLGSICAALASLPGGRRLALLALGLMLVGAVGGWLLAIRMLSRSRIERLARRAIFQLIVVPLAVFSPVLFFSLAGLTALLIGTGQPLVSAGAGAVVAAAMTLAAIYESRRAAVWVARPEEVLGKYEERRTKD